MSVILEERDEDLSNDLVRMEKNSGNSNGDQITGTDLMTLISSKNLHSHLESIASACLGLLSKAMDTLLSSRLPLEGGEKDSTMPSVIALLASRALLWLFMEYPTCINGQMRNLPAILCN